MLILLLHWSYNRFVGDVERHRTRPVVIAAECQKLMTNKNTNQMLFLLDARARLCRQVVQRMLIAACFPYQLRVRAEYCELRM